MKRAFLTMAVMLFAVTASAGLSDQYRKWHDTPEAYFMTAGERGEWGAIADDAAAQKFIDDYKAKRGGDKFTAEVKKRAEMADKYLSVGKIKGSTTLRGKLVVVFGPPAAMQTAERRSRTDLSAGPSDMGGGGELGVQVSAAGSDGGSQALGGRGSVAKIVNDFTFTFSAKNVPALGSDFTVVVEVDPTIGKDRLKDKKKQAELDAKTEAVAPSMIK